MMMATLLRMRTKGHRTIVLVFRLAPVVAISALVASAYSPENSDNDRTITLGNGSMAATEPGEIGPPRPGQMTPRQLSLGHIRRRHEGTFGLRTDAHSPKLLRLMVPAVHR